MKRIAPVLAACAVFTLGLSGCAGLDTAKSDFEVDQAKVAQIERAASRYGYQLVWVNKPTRKVVAPGG